MQRVYAYLMQERCIDEQIISYFAHYRLLYESYGTHNCVFVGCDCHGKPKAAHEKGTLSDRPYRRDCPGSSKDYFFHLYGGSPKLFVFEAPIDLMSFLTLHKNTNWQQHSYLALGGLSDRVLLRFLVEHPAIHQIVFCLDNDFDAKKKGGSPDVNHGQLIAKQYCNDYAKKGYGTSVFTPVLKDWNDILKSKQAL